MLHIKHLQVVATYRFSSGVALCCIRFVYIEDGNVIARVLDLVLTQTQVAVLLRKVSKDVELQEDRNVFAQLMMVSKSLPEIDIREAIGQHEFLVIPRSLFANDETMFHCSMKSALMSILEKTGESLDISRADDSVASSAPSTVTVAIID